MGASLVCRLVKPCCARWSFALYSASILCRSPSSTTKRESLPGSRGSATGWRSPEGRLRPNPRAEGGGSASDVQNLSMSTRLPLSGASKSICKSVTVGCSGCRRAEEEEEARMPKEPPPAVRESERRLEREAPSLAPRAPANSARLSVPTNGSPTLPRLARTAAIARCSSTLLKELLSKDAALAFKCGGSSSIVRRWSLAACRPLRSSRELVPRRRARRAS
mmetsp:Transcript_43489/g.107569  ORF Transcript_43489/g.107569 Transcript_43489/m.107569 type:complete len:221 (-) Transcript_43489:724-1386(-)